MNDFSNFIFLYVIPHSSKSLRAAILFSESEYLSDKNITSFIPACIIALAHSLHGNKYTYNLEPLKSACEFKKDLEVFEKAQKSKVLDRHLETIVPDEIFEELKKLV